jgi:hypothetical protein
MILGSKWECMIGNTMVKYYLQETEQWDQKQHWNEVLEMVYHSWHEKDASLSLGGEHIWIACCHIKLEQWNIIKIERELISKNSVAFLTNEEILFYIFMLFKNRWILFHLLTYKKLGK